MILGTSLCDDLGEELKVTLIATDLTALQQTISPSKKK